MMPHAEAQAAVATTRYAAMVLDLGLPDGDGLSILREIRQREDPLPVLVLTARGGLQDRVSGLRSGADDYLVKPFAFEELLARLEALLRRPGQLLGRALQIANLAFDTESRQAFIDGLMASGPDGQVCDPEQQLGPGEISERFLHGQANGLPRTAHDPLL